MSLITSGLTWQVDFTNQSSLIISTNSGGNPQIDKATNLSNPSLFFSGLSNNEPLYVYSGFSGPLGFSGTAQANGGRALTNKLGDYGSFTEYTMFLMVNNTGGTFNAFIVSYDDPNYSGQTQGYNWFESNVTTDPSYGTAGFFYRTTTNVVGTTNDLRASGDTNNWYVVGTRAYQSGSDIITEIWVDGVLTGTTTTTSDTLFTAVNPIFFLTGRQSFPGDILYTEALFYDRKLGNTEMTDNFDYFNQKYFGISQVTPTPTPTITQTPSVTPTIPFTPSMTPSVTPTPRGINFKTISDDFRRLADAHKQLNSYGLGDIEQISYWTQSRDKEENTDYQSPFYPLLYVVPSSVQNDLQYKTWGFNTLVMDIVERNLDNQIDVLSDTNQILQDVISQFRLSVTNVFGDYNDKYYLDDEVTCIPFLEKYDDLTNGWNGELKIKTMTPLDRCEAAYYPFTGNTSFINSIVISDGSYTSSNGTYTRNTSTSAFSKVGGGGAIFFGGDGWYIFNTSVGNVARNTSTLGSGTWDPWTPGNSTGIVATYGYYNPPSHETINFKTFHDDFRLLADYHKQINSFGFGAIDDLSFDQELRNRQDNTDYQSPYFPLMYVVPQNSIQKFGYMTFQFDVIVMDIIERDLSNQVDVLSDTNQILDDIISQFRLSVTDSLGNFNSKYYLQNPVMCTPFLEKYTDLTGGWSATISIDIMDSLDRCDAAFMSFLTPTPTVTSTNTPTPSVTPTNTITPTQTQTNTPTVTQTNTGTVTPTVTETPTNTPTTTTTLTSTPTPSVTETVTPTVTNTPTTTTTLTSTPTPSVTNTMTPSETATNTPTPSVTPTFTPTPSSTPVVNECIWNENNKNWDVEDLTWDVCPRPTPTTTSTNTPTPSSTPPASGTTEAQTYLRAVVDNGGTGITSTVSAATITMFTSLFSNNLYGKIKTMYPMLGGTSGSTKFNAINPIDTNAAFRLSFVGTGVTYDYSGITISNTALGGAFYANTNFNPVTNLTGNSTTVGIYYKNLATVHRETYWYGSYQGGTPERFVTLSTDIAATNTQRSLLFSRTNQLSQTGITYANMSGQYTQGNNGTNTFLRYNGTSIATGTDSTTRPSNNVYIGTLNLNGVSYRGAQARYQFFYISDSLTSGEAATIETIINTFQTSIGRNLY
jgi:hypothetical protein